MLNKGPVVSALVNRFGCRTITLIGTTLVAIGFFLSALATNVTTLYFTIGILAGDFYFQKSNKKKVLRNF